QDFYYGETPVKDVFDDFSGLDPGYREAVTVTGEKLGDILADNFENAGADIEKAFEKLKTDLEAIAEKYKYDVAGKFNDAHLRTIRPRYERDDDRISPFDEYPLYFQDIADFILDFYENDLSEKDRALTHDAVGSFLNKVQSLLFKGDIVTLFNEVMEKGILESVSLGGKTLQVRWDIIENGFGQVLETDEGDDHFKTKGNIKGRGKAHAETYLRHEMESDGAPAFFEKTNSFDFAVSGQAMADVSLQFKQGVSALELTDLTAGEVDALTNLFPGLDVYLLDADAYAHLSYQYAMEAHLADSYRLTLPSFSGSRSVGMRRFYEQRIDAKESIHAEVAIKTGNGKLTIDYQNEQEENEINRNGMTTYVVEEGRKPGHFFYQVAPGVSLVQTVTKKTWRKQDYHGELDLKKGFTEEKKSERGLQKEEKFSVQPELNAVAGTDGIEGVVPNLYLAWLTLPHHLMKGGLVWDLPNPGDLFPGNPHGMARLEWALPTRKPEGALEEDGGVLLEGGYTLLDPEGGKKIAAWQRRRLLLESLPEDGIQTATTAADHDFFSALNGSFFYGAFKPFSKEVRAAYAANSTFYAGCGYRFEEHRSLHEGNCFAGADGVFGTFHYGEFFDKALEEHGNIWSASGALRVGNTGMLEISVAPLGSMYMPRIVTVEEPAKTPPSRHNGGGGGNQFPFDKDPPPEPLVPWDRKPLTLAGGKETEDPKKYRAIEWYRKDFPRESLRLMVSYSVPLDDFAGVLGDLTLGLKRLYEALPLEMAPIEEAF
ncbi:MAG: hypothetical protein Q7T11_09050, partial [Deltaproteobacteria bacterium]|nr:hypothetical protein [Deltaproteobacteria bacterium]